MTEQPVISVEHLGLPSPEPVDSTWSETPSEQERKIVSGVYRLFRIAREHRRPLLGRWRRCYRALFNQNVTPTREPWKPTPFIPEILPIIRTQVGFIMDQRITHTVSPVALPGSDMAQFMAQVADDLETVLTATWQNNSEEREWTTAVMDGFVYGTGWVKTAWENTLAGGLGDAMTRRVHPLCVYPDPRATNEFDGDFYIESRYISLLELDRRHPGCRKILENSSGGEKPETPPNYLNLFDEAGSTSYIGNLLGNYSTVTSTQAEVEGSELPMVHVLECWLKEHSYETVTDQRTGERVKIAVPRWRVLIVAEGRLLMDEPASNLWSHGNHPFARYAPLDMGEFWAPSMVELLLPSQEAVNRILASLQQNVELTGNPIWKEASTAGEPRTAIINRPGQRVPVSLADQATGWVQPPRLDSSMIELLRYHLARMEVISGVSAIHKGLVPGGRNAQGVIDAVSESAFVVIRQAQRHLEHTMRVAGTKKADLIIENYTEPRFIAVAGIGGQRTAIALRSRHFQIPTPFGLVPLSYQLNIDAGSRRHTARAVMEDRAIQLGTLGLITPTAVLEAIDWPNAKEVGKQAEQFMLAGAQSAGQRRRARA